MSGLKTHEQATSGLSKKITFYFSLLIRAGYRFADVPIGNAKQPVAD